MFWLTEASNEARRAVVVGRSSATSGELPVLEPRRRPDRSAARCGHLVRLYVERL